MMRLKILVLTLMFLLCSMPLLAQIKVACVGNSITYGAAITNREVNCYPAQLQKMLGEGYVVGNYGRSGATLLARGHNPYIKTAEYTAAQAMCPDVVVIHLGINDTDPRNYPVYGDEFVPDYLDLISSFRAVNPAVRVIVARMTPIAHRHPRYKGGTREWHRMIQADIELVARVAKAELIDFEQVLIARPDLLPDAVHPNNQGALILAQRVYSAISGDFGGLNLNPLYTNNMVLQRSASTAIRGRANASERVKVSLTKSLGDGRENVIKGEGQADLNGCWTVALPLKDATGIGYRLVIATSDSTAVYENVAVGEVWIASGQSNMSLAVNQSAGAENALENPNIRLWKGSPTFEYSDSLSAQTLTKLNELDFLESDGWQCATKEHLKTFSAVAFYYAQELARRMPGVPIGVVQNSLGGATAESWIDRKTLEDDPWLLDLFASYRTNPMINEWCRSVIQKSLSGTKNPLQRHSFEPSYLYESRVMPIADYAIRGVLWYQGESNAENMQLHERLFPRLVSSWRAAFSQPELPFYFVQLSSIATRGAWSAFRDSQRRLSSEIPNCEMVICSDLGDSTDVHPRVKQPVGERLAYVALNQVYGFSKVPFRGPEALEVVGSKVTFANARGLGTSDGAPVRGFAIAGEDRVFRDVPAVIQGESVVLQAPAQDIRYVRYGWSPYTTANLVNGAKLPSSTFELCKKR